MERNIYIFMNIIYLLLRIISENLGRIKNIICKWYDYLCRKINLLIESR